MKKIASCLLALALLVTLTACSGKSDNLSDGTDTSGTVSDTVKDTKKGTETAPAETTGESNTTGAETGTEQPTSDSKATAPAKDTTSATNPPATNPPSTNPPATNPPTTPTTTVKTCNHSNTEVRNKKDATTSSDGYTGDTYCKDCGQLISSGESIPKIKQTVSTSHDYYDIEMKIFNEINAERTRAGLNALIWDEGLYAGAKIRSKEYYEYRVLGIGTGPHTRADGSLFITAVTENSSYSEGSFDGWAENCAGDRNGNTFVSDWMESSGHKENILRQNMKYIAIGVCYEDNMYFASTIFVG